jgi:hypothetical protein
MRAATVLIQTSRNWVVSLSAVKARICQPVFTAYQSGPNQQLALDPPLSASVYLSFRSERMTAYRRVAQKSGNALTTFSLFNTWGFFATKKLSINNCNN